METEEKLQLVKRNTVEIVTEEELRDMLEKRQMPSVYCGYEPNGPVHLGHLVTIIKLMDFDRAGFRVKVLLADVHAFLNRKGSEEELNEEIEGWKKALRAIGLNAEIVLGSSFEFSQEYQLDVMRLARACTINRGLRSMQEIARDVEHATISQLWYPLMQVVDIKYLDVDVAVGGIEQRKVHMIGRDEAAVHKHPFVAVHTPLITSLKGPGQKMAKTLPGSAVSVTDSYEEIRETVKSAYCPERVAQENPILEIAKLVIFPMVGEMDIERPVRFGGDVSYSSYDQLEADFVEGKLHPLDVKTAVTQVLERMIAPIRKNM